MREVQKVYRTDDGVEFHSEKDAARHEALEGARRRLAEAQRRFVVALATSQKTADGSLFSFRVWSYYRVRKGYGSLPQVETVSIGLRADSMEINAENALEFRVWMDDNKNANGGYWINLRFDELYSNREECQRACLRMMREYMNVLSEDIADYERGISND